MRIFIVLLCLLPTFLNAVDRSNFKTCEQSGFCKRHRAKTKSDYIVDPTSIELNTTALNAVLVGSENRLKFSVVLLEDSRIRFFVEEAGTPIRQRYHPDIALNGEPIQTRLVDAITNGDATHFYTKAGGHKISVVYNPFRIDVFDAKENLVITVNSQNLLKFEHFRLKNEGETSADGFWEETFKSHTDSKPYGSSSIGLDITFIGFKFLYGLPEHADSFALKSTTSTDPYRLYNLDVFEYELNNNMALYGSVPYVIAHNKQTTVGALWLNAAETWVDISSSTDKGLLASISEKFSSSTEIPQVGVHFISESGVIDLYLLLGPKPADVFRQNALLTGVSPLPPLFSIAYHQCRWNYVDEADVASVHDGFEKNDIPFDVIWLDIEYTDSKKYFTWDPVRFPHPHEMIQKLEDKGRKMVIIQDPHIKRDENYFVYTEGRDNGYFIKKSDDVTDYDGHCWPGSSCWPDFLNPVIRDYWSNKYLLDEVKNTFTWNDMNEPSVFSGPEVTMHKDAKHYGGWEHRDVHNIYGFYQTLATYEGHLRRSNYQQRPYILTRSFFVGSQRITSVWTGDNTADWGHLRIAGPMLLSLSVAGISHVGADIGGFFGNPDEQLLVRWYQAAAFQPFFRAHAHIDTKRREPYLFGNTTKNAIRLAIIKRYSYLPYWYTVFHEHSINGKPVMRPIWAEFPEDESGFDEEREWLVGAGLLVRPVTEPDVTSVSLYLPGKHEAWYEWDSHRMHVSPGAVYIDTPLEKIPIYQRGGTIIPLRERVRRSSVLMRNDPITLYVAAELNREFANGSLYLDDGETFNYANKSEYLYWSFTYKKLSESVYTITSKNLDTKGTFDPDVYIEKIVVRGIRYYPRNVHLYYDDYNPEDLEFTHDRDLRVLVIRKPGAYVSREWRIDIHT